MNTDFDPLKTLDQMLWLSDYPSHGAKRSANKPAIIADTGGYTYAELDEASNRFAEYLVQSGRKPGERIAYLGKNSEMFFPVLFGCLRTGVVLVPLNWRCAAAEITFMLEDSGAQLVIYDQEFAACVEHAEASLALQPQRLCTTAGAGVANGLASILNSASRPAEYRHDAPDECAVLLYTSGTSGRPKGVMLSHRTMSIARHVEIGSPDWADWNDDDVILSAMPNFHVGGMSWMLSGLVRSLTCVLTADLAPANLLALSRRHGATRTWMVPTVVRAVLDLLVAEGSKPPGLKSIHYGASVMDSELINRCLEYFPGCRFGQYFGMTEASGTVAFLPPKDHDASRPELLHSVGLALAGMEIDIRDPEGNRVPTGQAGEIWVKTPTIMLGYWNRPEATAEALVAGWYRTGDGGYLNQDGYLFLTDRIKDMIISGGENVYPAEVEAVLRLHPAIQDLVIVGEKDPVWGEVVTAVVEWRKGEVATIEALRSFGAKQIASYKLPKRIYSMEALPRTATGKLQRAAVRQKLAEGALKVSV